MPNNGSGRNAVGVEFLGGEYDAHCTWKAADNRRFRYIRGLLDRVLHLGSDGTQLIAVVMLTPKGQGQDWDIIDRTSLDDRLRNSRRHPVEVRVELAIDLDQ